MIGPHQKTGSGHGNERAVGAHVATQSAQYPRSHAQQGAVALGSDLDFADVLPGVGNTYIKNLSILHLRTFYVNIFLLLLIMIKLLLVNWNYCSVQRFNKMYIKF